MKRSRSDAFGEDAQPCKLQRVDHQCSVFQGSIIQDQSQDVDDVDVRRVMDEFIVIYEGLDTTDDPLVKPNYSYTELVYLALLRSPNFCLPISEIYKYIQFKFQFFRRNTREHWRNAVRHSLSKTKCFTKIGARGPNSSGTYNRSMFLWTFNPSSIVNFARGDYRHSVDKESGTNTLRWGYYRINAGAFWDRVSVAMESKMLSFQNALISSPVRAEIFEHQTCNLLTSEDQPPTMSPSTPAMSLSSASPIGSRYATVPYPSNSPTLEYFNAGSYQQFHFNYSSHVNSYTAYPTSSPCQYNRHSEKGYHYAGQGLESPLMAQSTSTPVLSPDYPASSPCQYNRHSERGNSYTGQGQTSPLLVQSTSTPVLSPADISTHHNTPASSPVSWESSRTYSATRDSSSCDSVSGQSWSSFHDSGLYSDYSSPEDTYSKFYSPPGNVNMFSPCYYTKTSNNVRITPEQNNHQLFPNLTTSTLLDSSLDFGVIVHNNSSHSSSCASRSTQSSCVFSDSKPISSSSFASTQNTLETNCLLLEDELQEFLQDFHPNMLSSIDNLVSYCH